MKSFQLWLYKILSFGIYEKGENVDGETITLMVLSLVIYGLIIATIIWLISLVIDHFRYKKENQQFNAQIDQFKKLLIKHANENKSSVIDALIDSTPEIKEAYQKFKPEDRDYMIYQILDDIVNNSNDSNEVAVMANTATTINNTNNTIF